MSNPSVTTHRPPRRRPAGRWAQFAFAVVGVFTIVLGWLLFAGLITGIGTAVVWLGLPVLLLELALLRRYCDLHRRIAGAILGRRIVRPYRPRDGQGVLHRLATVLSDPATWRDVAFLLVALTVGFALNLAAMIAFIVFPIGIWLGPLLMRMVAGITRTLIGPTDEAVLQERIGELETTRSESIDHSAAELRRIERDLHDGAQAQLVALGMNLGLAEDLITRDPRAAAGLIADARRSSTAALSDLRSLVRGIHPPVLADRGLDGGLHALALAQPGSVDVDVVLDGRPPLPVETAVYFAVAEALTNSAKYAAAQHTWIWARHEDGTLRVLIGDDGVGGARPTAAGGLAGLERRLAAFDGTITVASPLGGPTIVTVVVPCVLEPAPTHR